MEVSISVLETIVQKYGSTSYSDVVFGLELVNEPVVWNTASADQVADWAKYAFDALLDLADNQNLKIIMHDAFVGAAAWETVGEAINGDCDEPSFYIDLHLYQNQDSADVCCL